MEKTERFNVELIKSFLQNWTEGPELDFKAEYYSTSDPEGKRKFIRHLIAFANIARRIGRPCYMVFGIEEPGGQPPRLLDVTGKYPYKCEEQEEDFYTSAQAIQKHFGDLIQQYITPLIHFEFEMGYFDEKMVSYIKILPVKEEPYRCKCELKSHGKTLLYVNDSFIRCGSSSYPVDYRQLTGICDLPYVDKKKWGNLKDYLTTGDFHKAYEEISIHEIETDTCDGLCAFNLICQEVNKHQRIIALVGEAGTGKTVLLQRVAYHYASQLLDYMDISNYGEREIDHPIETEPINPDQLEVTPLGIIPIFISLRTSFYNKKGYEDYFDSQVNAIFQTYGEKIHCSDLFRLPNTKWLVILDALDEVHDLEKTHSILENWLKSIPENVTVLISMRPQINYSMYSTVIKISQVDQDQIFNIFSKKISMVGIDIASQDKLARYFKRVTDQFPDILNLLGRLRFLDAFIIALTSRNLEKPSIDQSILTPPKFNYEDIIYPSKTTRISSSLKKSLVQGLDEISLDSDYFVEEDASVETIEEVMDEKEDSISIILKKMFDYVNNEERKRIHAIDRSTGEICETAFLRLEEFSTKYSWDKIDFEDKKIPKKILLWNENAGYIRRSEIPIKYSFSNWLARKFFISDYLFFTITLNTSHFTKLIGRHKKEKSFAEVYEFASDYFLTNGRIL